MSYYLNEAINMLTDHAINIAQIICLALSLGGIFLVGFSAGFNSAVDFIEKSKEDNKHDSN